METNVYIVIEKLFKICDWNSNNSKIISINLALELAAKLIEEISKNKKLIQEKIIIIIDDIPTRKISFSSIIEDKEYYLEYWIEKHSLKN